MATVLSRARVSVSCCYKYFTSTISVRYNKALLHCQSKIIIIPQFRNYAISQSHYGNGNKYFISGSIKSTSAVNFLNGLEMPVIGLGTFQATNSQELERALDAALTVGYRHIDTAYFYQNEAVIGNVLKRWFDEGKLKREDLFVVTKLPSHGMHPSKVGHFLKLSLASLQLDYVDLYLVHTPTGVKYVDDDVTKLPFKDGKFEIDKGTNLEEIWGAMEAQVDAGLAKSIGISNFNCGQVERMMKVARIQPANNQIEVSVYCQRKDVRETCAKHGITVCAYAPLGRPGSKDTDMLQDPVIVELAQKHNKTPAQVALRFLLQQNLVIIPKSVTPPRIQQNFEVFDFNLSDAELNSLIELDQGISGRVSFNPKVMSTLGFEDHPEWPFPRD